MTFARRQFLHLAGAAIAFPATPGVALAQAAQGSPKLTQILRGDLEGQGEKVQESVVSILEMGPGVAAPWHAHPGAQELLFVYEGSLIIEIEGRAATIIKTGEVGLIPADIPHLARNEVGGVAARALVMHSRADKQKPLTVAVKRTP